MSTIYFQESLMGICLLTPPQVKTTKALSHTACADLAWLQGACSFAVVCVVLPNIDTIR